MQSMDTTSDTTFIGHIFAEDDTFLAVEDVQNTSPEIDSKADTPRFLVTMYVGIGDAVASGLSMVDQIIENDADAYGKIDVLCNSIQAEIFEDDPRINRVIPTSNILISPPEVTLWLKGIMMDSEATKLISFLRKRRYEAVFPGVFTPALYSRLRSRVIYPNVVELGKIFFALRAQVDMPMSKIARQIINRSFGKSIPTSTITEEVPLYISSEQVQKAIAVVAQMKSRAGVGEENSKLLVVAPDTASVVTRPPTNLLAIAIAQALKRCRNLIVCILPSYTDTTASTKLFHSLARNFDNRVFLMSSHPQPTLLDTTAFIDQADIFVTGDTGVMHLAAARKRLKEGDKPAFFPRNAVNIIALFGGTNPCLYGYSQRTLILGRGRPEQVAYRPGIAKESYNPRGRNLFDHISPLQLTEAITSHISP